jgi:hypothetical protein
VFSAGSRMLRRRPRLLNVCEKSPCVRAAVGIRLRFSVPGSVLASTSCDQKKNRRLRCRLNSIDGSKMGPTQRPREVVEPVQRWLAVHPIAERHCCFR